MFRCWVTAGSAPPACARSRDMCRFPAAASPARPPSCACPSRGTARPRPDRSRPWRSARSGPPPAHPPPRRPARAPRPRSRRDPRSSLRASRAPADRRPRGRCPPRGARPVPPASRAGRPPPRLLLSSASARSPPRRASSASSRTPPRATASATISSTISSRRLGETSSHFGCLSDDLLRLAEPPRRAPALPPARVLGEPAISVASSLGTALPAIGSNGSDSADSAAGCSLASCSASSAASSAEPAISARPRSGLRTAVLLGGVSPVLSRRRPSGLDLQRLRVSGPHAGARGRRRSSAS